MAFQFPKNRFQSVQFNEDSSWPTPKRCKMYIKWYASRVKFREQVKMITTSCNWDKTPGCCLACKRKRHGLASLRLKMWRNKRLKKRNQWQLRRKFTSGGCFSELFQSNECIPELVGYLDTTWASLAAQNVSNVFSLEISKDEKIIIKRIFKKKQKKTWKMICICY